MKMTITKTILALAIGGSVAMLTTARANTILNVGLSDSHTIGEVFGSASNGGEPAHDDADINQLIGMTPSTGGSFTIVYGTYTYDRSANTFGTLPLATATGASYNGGPSFGSTEVLGGITYLKINLTQGFTYLMGKYDGQNGGGNLWYIGNIAAGTVIDIPLYAAPVDGQLVAGDNYLMTSFLLSNPKTTVPDGASTACLLGLAVTGIGLIKRRLK